MLSWDDVAASEKYQALPPEKQAAAKQQYFNTIVAPRVPEAKRAKAWQQFSAYQPEAGLRARDVAGGYAAKLASGAVGAIADSTVGAVDTAQRVARRIADPEDFDLGPAVDAVKGGYRYARGLADEVLGGPGNKKESSAPGMQYAKPGPYTTQLSPTDETEFQQWVKQNDVPWKDDPHADYDMRGFFAAARAGDPNASTAVNRNDGRIHYPDTYKTPYHKSFSRESRYATDDAPQWNDKDQLVLDDGTIVFDERAPKNEDQNGTHIRVPNLIGRAIDTIAPEGSTVRNVARAMGSVPGSPGSLVFGQPIKDTAGYERVVKPAVDAVQGKIDAMTPTRYQRAEQAFSRDLDAASNLGDPLQEAKAVAATIINHPAVSGGVIAESAPSMAASVLTGRAVVTTGAKLVAAQALESGMSPLMAKTLADTWMQTSGTKLASAAVAGNATAQSVSSTVDQVADAIKNTPDDVLQKQSPRYAEARQYATEEQAKRAMMASARSKTANSVALTTGLSSLLTAGFEAKLGLPAGHGIPESTIGKHILEGVLKEGAQETFESGGEQYGQNAGMIESGADPDMNPMKGVVSQALLGGAAGAVMGGAAGGVHAGASRIGGGHEAEPVPSDSTVNESDAQDMSQGTDNLSRPSATVPGGPSPGQGGDDISEAFENIEGNNDAALEPTQGGQRSQGADEQGGSGSGDEPAIQPDAESASSQPSAEAPAGRPEAVQPVRGEAGESQLPLDQAAHEAATSPHNELAEPSTAQKEAGNYRKGHLKLHGLDISIENPKGSTRSGTDRSGKDWSVQMKDHYGYIRNTKGNDKEHIDVYVGPKPLAKVAYVVDQIDPETRKFDEHKIMLGYNSSNDARESYQRNYSDDWRGIGAITAVPVDQLKTWLSKPQTKPFGKLTKLTPIDEPRLKNADARQDLEAMAPDAGWSEVGGRAVRTSDAGGTKQVLAIDDYGQPTGDIVDRTKWIPRAPWFPAVQREARLPNNESGKATRDAVSKAIAGEPMTAAEKRHVGAILDWADAERRDYEERGASGIDPFDLSGAAADNGTEPGVSLVDEALVAKAHEIDEAAVERAALQHDDESAFMAAIQEIIDGTSKGQEANRAAGEDGEGVQRAEATAVGAGERVERGKAAREAGSEVDEHPQDLTLDQQSEEDLAARAQQQRDSEAADESKRRSAEDKAAADRERADFRLSGSEQPADIAMAGGQQDLLSSDAKHEDDRPDVTASLARRARNHVSEVADELRDGQSNAILIPMEDEGTSEAAGRSIKAYETALEAAGFTKQGKDWTNDHGSLWLRSQGAGSAPIVQYKAANPKPAAEEDESTAAAPVPLRIEQHGKLIIVRGETKPNKDRIKAIKGALWNRKAEGWTFRADLEPRVREALADLLGDNSSQIADVAEQRGTLETTKDEADGKPENTLAPEQLQAGDSGEDRIDGRAGEPDRGSVGERVAEADEAPRGQREADSSDSVADGVRAESEGSRSGESLDGRNRDTATGRSDGRPAGIVDEPAGDHVITDADEVGEGGEKTKARNNLAAIELVKRLAEEDRSATAEERRTLSRYVGWGGLKNVFDPKNQKWTNEHNRLKAALTPAEFDAARASMLDAHYTSLPVVDSMWQAIGHLGFDGGRVMEPSLGSGNFFGRMPTNIRSKSVLNGVELDKITGMIVKQLYQTADIAAGTGFQDVVYPKDYADLVIGNPPFGSQVLFDATMPAATKGFSIHNFFFAKAVEITRPGGLVAMVVSHNLMDQVDGTARNWIAERAHLRGAVRLPYTAFLSNAGTEVVTDILFLQKAMPGEQTDKGWAKTGTVTLKAADGGDREFQTSTYFHDHPEMILGEQAATGKMYGRPDQYNVAPRASADLGDVIREAVLNMPADVYVKSDKPVDIPAVRDAMVPENTKVYGYFMGADGETVMQRTTDTFDGKAQSQPVEFSDKTSPRRAAGMIEVRDALRDMMRSEMTEGVSDARLADLRKSLNRAYDVFVKKFGFINAQTNRRAFRDDPDLPLLESLEPKYDPGISKEVAKKREIEPRAASAGKADIFSRRVLSPSPTVTSVSTAKDALVASLNTHGGVDPEYMAELYGKDFDAIAAELGDLVYQDPDDRTWSAADAYLSGNVKHKLKLAKAAAGRDSQFARNVAALEAVQPVDVPALKIGVRLGSPWLPHATIEDFARTLLGPNSKPVARYVRAVGRWSVDIIGADQAASISRWGTERVPAGAVMSAVMNNKQILVKDNVGSAKEPVWVVNEPETEAARARAEEMAAKFKEWVWEDEDRRTKLEKLYNDGYNTDRRREYDGSHLTLPGKVPDSVITLLQHQKSGIWRGIQESDLLLDHVVGAGKTFEMAGIAMELRRLGTSRKPVLAVPNHLVRQWRDEIYKLYPNANVLAATEADFEKKNRKRLFGKIATGDWDAVIVGHSSFQKLAAPHEAQKQILDEQLKEITDAIESLKRDRGDRNVMRDMERIKQNLSGKLKLLSESAGTKDDVTDFGELGIDALFVDEAHLFKNLFYMSQMRGIAGMGSPAGSGRAFDLFVKTQYLRRRYGKQARVVFATGTPVSNSLVEMYTMQRYLAYDELKRRGISTLDAWAGVYGDVQNVYEVHPSGTGYRLKTRFAKFVNLPSLMELYRSFADVVSLDDLKAQSKKQGKRFPVPNVAGGKPKNLVADRSPNQTEFFGVPEFARDADGSIKFKYPADLKPALNGDGKWILVGGKPFMVKGEERQQQHAGPYESEAEAKEQADALVRQPVVGYNKDSILWKFENLRELTKKTNGKINALSVTNEARKAGLDYRLIDPAAPDFEGSKINHAVSEIKRIYDKWTPDRGTQLVFCDLSTPKSARASAATKEKPAFIRDQTGALKRVKATVAAIDGQPVAFLVVKQKPGVFRVFDGLTGVDLNVQSGSREDAVTALRARLDRGSGWVDQARGQNDEIDEDAIAEWKSQQESSDDDTSEEDDSISLGDLLALSGGGKFSVYDDVKAKLIKAGIPEKEVAFIHDFDTAAKKNDLYKMVRSGEVRVVLGSTEKMGAGTNVQERLVAEHHLDAPWRPSDLEQREGRIIRQGNSLYMRDPDGFEVEINRYATKQTYDTRMWQLIEHKAAGIEQLRKADASVFEIDDVGGEEANAADMKAAASGNPLILEEIKLRNEVKSLEAQQYAHQSSLISLQDRLRRAKGAKAKAMEAAAQLDPLIEAADLNPKEPFAFAVGKKLYTEKKEAAGAVMKAFHEAAQMRTGEKIAGNYRGVAIVFSRDIFGISVEGHAGSGEIHVTSYGKDDQFSPLGLFTKIDNKLAVLEHQKNDILRDADQQERAVPELEKEAKRPFAKADDLVERRSQHRKVMNQLAKSGGGISLTPEMQRELKKALRARIGASEDEAPNVSAAVRGTKDLARSPLTAEAARAVAEDALGAAGITNLVRKGILEFVGTASQMPPALQDYVEKYAADNLGHEVVALADHSAGKVYIIGDRVRAADVPGLVMHEVGEHFGLSEMIGEKSYRRLLGDVRDMHSRGESAELNAAWDYVKVHYESLPDTSDEFASEVIARLSESEPFRKTSLWRRLMSWIRQFLFKLGLTKVWRLKDSDLGQMVAAALRRTMMLGTVTPTAAGEVRAAADSAPVYFSQLREIVVDKLSKKGGAKLFKSAIEAWQRKGEFKKEELEWSGLTDWLDTQGPTLTKADVLAYLDQNRVDVQEVMADDDQAPTRFHEYQVQGGQNYRELLLTLPPANDGLPRGHRVEQRGERNWAVILPSGTVVDRFPTREAAIDSQRRNTESDNFRSSHFDQPNILAHVRFNERTDADGKRVLFIEEVQSDWHQAGRKNGYGPAKSARSFTVATYPDGRVVEFGRDDPAAAEAARNGATLQDVQTPPAAAGVPDAPFKQSWPMLAMKRMIRYAAENGFDKIAWTTGEQQSARYDLRQHYDAIWARKGSDGHYDLMARVKGGKQRDIGVDVPPEKLPDIVGKELADRIAKGEGAEASSGYKMFSGIDLKVGGEGMQAFYDRELVNDLNRYVKKWGGKVSNTRIQVDPLAPRFASVMLGRQGQPASATGTATVHALDLTPEMRAAATRPQPLFAVRSRDGESILQKAATLAKRMRVANGSDMARRAIEGFLNKPIVNIETGITATVSGAALRKMIGPQEAAKSVTPAAHAAAVANLDHLFEIAVLRDSRPGRKSGDDETIERIHVFDAPMPVDGKILRARMLAKEFKQEGHGTRLYIVHALEVGDAGVVGQDPLVSGQFRRSEAASQPPPGVEDRFAELIAAVKSGRIQAAARATNGVSRQQQIEDEAWRKAGLPRENSTMQQRLEHWAMNRWAKVKEDLLDNFQSGMFDRFKPIKDAEGNVDPERSGYISARMSTGGSSVLYASMLYGAPEMTQGVVQKKAGSRGLLEILEPVANDLNRWAAWMVGKRADMLADQHRENNLNLEEIAYLKSLAGDNEAKYEAVAKDVREFMTDVLRVMQTSGLLNADQVTEFSKDAYYLPFYRVDEDGDVTRPYTKRGLSHQSSQIKRLKGGKTAISDPIENLFAHLSRSIDASMKNYAMARTITNTARHLTVAKEGDRAKAIRVMWKGKPYWFNVDQPDLLRALTAVGEKPRDGLALNIGRSMRSLLTTGITLDPAFMARNFSRDTMHSWLIDKNSMKFGVDALKGAKATLRSIRAESSGNFEDADPAVVSMMFAGASFVGGHVYGLDPKANAAAMRKALRRKGMSDQQANSYMGSLVTTTKHFASLYVEVGEAIENANRVAAFKAARESGVGLTQALYESKDLMDFSLRGQWTAIQVMSDVLPFFNARLQGLYKLGRETRRDPKVLGLVATRIAARGALMALASIALVAAYSGDKRYEELEEWDKDANWHFWVGGVHYRIPKPFELGILFATMPERMYRLAGGFDKFGEAVQSMVHNISGTLAVNPFPQAIRPLAELYFNFDMFRGRPIESAADQGKLPEDRYSARTSPVMVGIGQATGISPKKLEYAWNGYLGTMGTYALGFADWLVHVARKDVAPTSHIEDYPIIGSFFRTGPAWSTEYQTELYDLSKEAEQTWRSLRDKYAEGEDAAGDRIAEEKEGLLSARKMLNHATDRLSNLNKQRDAILRDHDMSPQQKRDQLDELQLETNMVSEEAVKNAEAMGVK